MDPFKQLLQELEAFKEETGGGFFDEIGNEEIYLDYDDEDYIEEDEEDVE